MLEHNTAHKRPEDLLSHAKWGDYVPLIFNVSYIKLYSNIQIFSCFFGIIFILYKRNNIRTDVKATRVPTYLEFCLFREKYHKIMRENEAKTKISGKIETNKLSSK